MRKKLISYITAIVMVFSVCNFSVISVSAASSSDTLPTDITNSFVHGVVSGDPSIEGTNVIYDDLYILNGSELLNSGELTIYGDVYVFGALFNEGTLTVEGALNGLHYGSMMSAGDYDYGYINNIGKIKADTLNITDDFLNVDIPSSDHRMTISYVLTNPSCGYEGTRHVECDICGYSEEVSIPATGNHSFEFDGVRKDNCFENWRNVYSCSDCYTEKEESIAATGHDFGDWYYTCWPDCEYEGELARECYECYYTEYKTEPALGHEFGTWIYESESDRPTCEDEGFMYRYCKTCGDYDEKVVAALGHNYKTTTTKATSTKNGSVVKKCTKCNDVSKTTIYKPNKMKLSTAKYVYNGKVKKPTVKVYDSKGNLISSSNYTVKYAKGRKTVGKYKVTVTFKSTSKKYKGALNTTFQIVPKSTSITKLTKAKKAFTVKWSKRSTQVTGYQIRYSTKSDMSNANTKLVKSYKTTSKKITGLKGGKKYYVQVRTYKTVNGTKYYSAWSGKKSVKTTGSSSSNTSNNDVISGNTVYITSTGTKYHFNKNCRGLSNANGVKSVSLSSAKAQGYTLCGYED